MNRYTRILAIFTAAYIVLALIWWSFLLFHKNEALYESNLQLREMADQYGFHPAPPIPEKTETVRIYRRQRMMIIGESLFILISVSIGIWLIFRSYMQEQGIIRQRRNFLLSITHELKTPLTAMRLAFETIQKRDLSRDQLSRLITSSVREADRLTETVNNLLLTARMDRKYVPRLESRSLSDAVENWKVACQNHWPDRQISFQLDSPPQTSVVTDWSGLDIIFRNLMENAVKYSGLEAPIKAVILTNNTHFCLTVSDSGPGIPPSEKNRIFDMFYRIGNEDTREGKGTGLGLYLVREIVHQNKGKIKLRSNEPQGSRFIIQMPI
ncbi:MAG: HAMP domain-containing histidine kinase [Saprospiraceae bacterium]|nr:HAMP domain-containing histidine kinase [Saprospiraceae bacterium]